MHAVRPGVTGRDATHRSRISSRDRSMRCVGASSVPVRAVAGRHVVEPEPGLSASSERKPTTSSVFMGWCRQRKKAGRGASAGRRKPVVRQPRGAVAVTAGHGPYDTGEVRLCLRIGPATGSALDALRCMPGAASPAASAGFALGSPSASMSGALHDCRHRTPSSRHRRKQDRHGAELGIGVRQCRKLMCDVGSPGLQGADTSAQSRGGSPVRRTRPRAPRSRVQRCHTTRLRSPPSSRSACSSTATIGWRGL